LPDENAAILKFVNWLKENIIEQTKYIYNQEIVREFKEESSPSNAIDRSARNEFLETEREKLREGLSKFEYILSSQVSYFCSNKR
jgi:hypothetical protein